MKRIILHWKRLENYWPCQSESNWLRFSVKHLWNICTKNNR